MKRKDNRKSRKLYVAQVVEIDRAIFKVGNELYEFERIQYE